jgi:GMP synthase-like glutamine amidotransferase
MNVLIIMHVEAEGPGTLGTFLESRGAVLHTVRLHKGDPLPDDPRNYSAIVSLGGPMNVYEDDKYPFLKEETPFLKRAVHAEIPTVGICLGAQMIAKACGAEVIKSPREEIGWGMVSLTDEGRVDELFKGLTNAMEVLQWHGDMFQIPVGGILTATGRECPKQAFRYKKAFGLQYHVEVTEEILSEWFADSSELERIISRYRKLEPVLRGQAERMYENLVKIVQTDTSENSQG